VRLELFLSHAPSDDAFCAALLGALRAAGATVWDAPYALSAGRLPAHTAVEVRHCPVFLVVLSPAALASEEAREACALAYFAARNDPTRLLLPAQATSIVDQTLATTWPFAQAFMPVEGESVHVLSPAEGIQATLTTLLLRSNGRALKAPSISSLKDVEQTLLAIRVLLEQERYREAAPLADYSVKLVPERFDVWMCYGGVHLQRQHGRQALTAADRALALQPDNGMAWLLRAGALLARKRPADALQAADTALRIDSVSAEAWVNRAVALQRLKRYEEALAAYEQATLLNPSSPLYWLRKAEMLMNLNDRNRIKEVRAALAEMRRRRWQRLRKR
jgi:tetratricopeptide (TPR) repeat protein